jgi:hypothetical protein
MKVLCLPGELIESSLFKMDFLKFGEMFKLMVEAQTRTSIGSSLSIITYPFTPQQENYYTSFWMQGYTQDVLEMALSYPGQFSLRFLSDYLTRFPECWPRFVCNLESLLGSSIAQQVHDTVIGHILCQGMCTPNQETVEVLKNYKPFKPPIVMFVRGESIDYDPEETALIKSIFGVKDLKNSDIAMTKTSEFFDPDEFRFKLVIEVNEAAIQLLGINLEDYAKVAMTAAGMIRIKLLYWPYDKTYWAKLTRFWVGSFFKQPTHDTDITIWRNAKGDRIPCLIHFFASYDPDSGVRTAASCCLRPLSSTFNPRMRKLLINKSEFQENPQVME